MGAARLIDRARRPTLGRLRTHTGGCTLGASADRHSGTVARTAAGFTSTTRVLTTSAIAKTPEPPYYAVIFSSRANQDVEGYVETALRMEELARQQRGFLGFEFARGSDRVGLTISYWESEEAIAGWKRNAEHLRAQQRGREQWYADYEVRVARVERAYGMGSDPRVD